MKMNFLFLLLKISLPHKTKDIDSVGNSIPSRKFFINNHHLFATAWFAYQACITRVLEKSEDPDAGVSDCLQYLKQLHDIKAIQEIFSVIIDGGIKSRFNKTKRLSNASSVYQMNVLLFEFARRFTNLRTAFFDWPMILLGKKTHHPLLRDGRLERYSESRVKITSPYPNFTFPKAVRQSCCVINSEREVVARLEGRNNFVRILKPSGESRTIFDPSKQEDASDCEVYAMDIDAEDNVYVIMAFRESDDQLYSFKLLVFDKHGDKKLESLLPFQCEYFCDVCMAINNDKKIAVVDMENQILRIGTLCKTDSFEVDNSFHIHKSSGNEQAIRFLDDNGTKIIFANSGDCFYIYTENGELERKVIIPEEYRGIWSVAINYITKRILVMAGVESVYLCSFSEAGELKNNVYLGREKYDIFLFDKVISNPHGAVALVKEWRVIFLQL